MKDSETGGDDAAMFRVGPAEPVTDSRELPAVSADQEAGFVLGADMGDAHPDNVELTVDPDVPVGLVTDQDDAPDEELPDLAAVNALIEAEATEGGSEGLGFDVRDVPLVNLKELRTFDARDGA
ncbi:hypothetical protein GCM10027446_15650 [Angustibacter peucedani]